MSNDDSAIGWVRAVDIGRDRGLDLAGKRRRPALASTASETLAFVTAWSVREGLRDGRDVFA